MRCGLPCVLALHFLGSGPWKRSAQTKRPRAELNIKAPSRQAGPASESRWNPPGSDGLQPLRNPHIRPARDPGRSPRGQVPGVPREQRRRGRCPSSAPRPQEDLARPAEARAREERRARRRAGPAHLPGRRLLPPGARRKHQRSPPSPGRGAGLREGRGPTLRAELPLLGAGPSHCRAGPRA